VKNKVIIGSIAILITIMAVTLGLYFNNVSKNLANEKPTEAKAAEEKLAVDKGGYTIQKVSSEFDVLWVSTEDLYKNADVVVLVDYENDVKNYASVSGNPMTQSYFKVKKVYKGDIKEQTSILVNYRGGTITLEQYMATQTPEQLKKKGLADIPQKDRAYILFEYESSLHDFSFKTSPKNYILFLVFDKNTNKYVTLCVDYGI